MDSINNNFNFSLDDKKPSFTTAVETKPTSTATFVPSERSAQDSVFSPLAAPFQGRSVDLLNNVMEPRPIEQAPPAAEIDFLTYRSNNDNDSVFGENNSHQNFYMGGNSSVAATESVASSSIHWGDSGMSSSGVSSNRGGEMMETFDFLVKSLSSANNYVSMLTREQLSVLRSIRPSLLYEFLQEVAKVRGDKRSRRALPTECAFCKNNGENEECYSSHALKDWRGRVLCPVLRAFRCPRCGATGDRAHTIKYCPEPSDGSSQSRRRGPALSTLTMMGQMGQVSGGRTPQTPQPSSPAPQKPAWWTAYGMGN